MTQTDQQKGKVFFYRRLVKPRAGSNGGNLKLRDCFNHIQHSSRWQPLIHFDPDTIWDDYPGNHWRDLKPDSVEKIAPQQGDLLFFSGHDWNCLSTAQQRQPPVPIINIVQPRHTRKQDKRQAFLKLPAIRIAKSEHGANILRQHGVNGPLFVVPDAIDLSLLPAVPDEKDIDVLILGTKQPGFAKQVYQKLQAWANTNAPDLNIQLQLPPMLPTRLDFLRLLARAKIVGCIPLAADRGSEGFYLPALEAMALETLVVCPHAVGNLGHCLHEENCIVPPFSVPEIIAGIKQMLATSLVNKNQFRKNGLATAQKHRIEHERSATLDILDQAYELWNKPELFLTSPPASSTLWQRIVRKFQV